MHTYYIIIHIYLCIYIYIEETTRENSFCSVKIMNLLCLYIHQPCYNKFHYSVTQDYCLSVTSKDCRFYWHFVSQRIPESAKALLNCTALQPGQYIVYRYNSMYIAIYNYSGSVYSYTCIIVICSYMWLL